MKTVRKSPRAADRSPRASSKAKNRRPAGKVLARSIAAIACLAVPHFASATNYYWDTTTTGPWQTGANWSLDPTGSPAGTVVPTATDFAFFNGSGVNGNEIVTLTGATSIAGITFQNTGTTLIDSSSTTSQALSIGTGGISILANTGAVTIGNATNGAPITVTGTESWTNNSSNLFTVVNALTLAANPLTIAGSGATTITGAVSGTVAVGSVQLTVGTGAGSGTILNLTNTGNAFAGDIAVNGGTIAYTQGTATTTSQLGIGSGSVFKQVLLTNGGAFQVSTADFNDNVPTTTNKGAGVVFNVGAGGGGLIVDAGRILTIDDGTGSGTALTASELQGTGALTKTGAGVLVLGNAASFNDSVYTGQININQGVLRLNNTTTGVALGSTSAGTVVASGAALDLGLSTGTSAEPLTISGTGAGANALYNSTVGNATNAIYSSSGSASSFAGPITLAANSTIGAGAAGTMTLSGGVTGAFNLTINNLSTGGTTFSTAAVNNAGTITNSGAGAGTTTIGVLGALVTGISQTGTSPLTLTPAYPANQLGFTISNSGSGLYTLTGGVSSTGSGSLVFNATSTGGITSGAIASTGTVTNSGTGAGTVTITGSIGSTITSVTDNSTTSPFIASGGLVVNAGGTTLINNNSTAAGFNLSGGAVSGTGNLILQNNTAVGTAISTVGGTTGGLTLGGINNTGTLTNSGTGSGPVYITGAIGTAVTAINQNSTTSPLVITGGTAGTTTGTVTIANGATVQLGNQAANNLALGTGTINTNTSGALIFAPGTTALTYPNLINGSGTVTVNGLAAAAPASITLSSTTGTFTGTYTLNQGRIVVTAQTNLGSGTTSPIVINGNSGTLTGGQLLVNAAVAIGNAMTLNGYGPSEAAGNLGALRLNVAADSYTGAISLGSNASINTQNTAGTLTSTAVISGGAGAQLMIGTPITGTGAGNAGGTLTIQSTNTYSGGTLISGQTAALGAAGALGTGPVQVGINATQTNSALTESVANALTGANSLTVNGGTATLSTANNFTGGVTVNGGTLAVNAAGALGSNNLVQVGGAVTESTANALSGPITLNLSGGTTALSQANGYTGGANISGTNITTVSAAGGLVGTTSVTAGGLLISTLATGLAQGGNIVNSGGVLASPVTGGQFQNVALSGTGVINPGGAGVVATAPLTVTNLITSGGTLQFDTTAPSSTDLLSVNGTYSFGSGTGIALNYFNQFPTTVGTYKLIQYSGSAPTLANFSLPSAPSGQSYALNTTSDPGFVDLVISGSYAGATSNWIPTSAGPNSWNTSGNWTGGVIPHLTGDTANFATANTAAQTVTVDGQQHIGSLTLNPSGFAYTINQGTAGSTLYLDNGASAATITNTALNNTIAAPLVLVSSNTNITAGAGTNLTLSGAISGAGKLTLASGSGSVTVTGTSPSYTGGTEIDSGSIIINNTAGGAFTQLNNAGVGTTTLNGGTLNFTGTSGTQTNTPANFVLNIGPNGGTFNTGGATSGVNGKVLAFAGPGFLTGSGTLTKTGGGDLQLPAANSSIGFTGNVILSNNGLIEDQSVAALGFGATAGFNGGSVTLNGPSGANAPELVTSGIQIFNPITLNGGTLSANSNANGIFNSTVTVTAASTLRASQFQGQTSAQNFAVNTLTGSANLAVNGSTTANAIGMVTVGSASGYTGNFTIGSNAALGIGNSVSSNFLSGGTTLTFSAASSGLGLVTDGDGSSSPEQLNFALPSNPINFGAGNTTGYIVGKQGANTFFNQAANKTLLITDNTGTPAALPYNNPSGTVNTLNVQPINGFGLLLTAQPALTGTTTFGVGTVASVSGVAPASQASNVVPGLTVENLTGGFGIVKSGAGTLFLSSAGIGNAFGGAGLLIDITGGILEADSDAALGDPGNGIRLNVNSATQGFRALAGMASTSRTITLNAAANDLEVATGNTFTVNSGLSYGAVGNALTKNDNGTLVLATQASGAPSSGTTINAGALRISNSNQIGSGTITVAGNTGAALQLTGGPIISQAISIGSSAGLQSRGGIENVSGATTLNGVITSTAAYSVIGNDDAGNIFTLGTGGIVNNGSLAFVGASGSTIKSTGVISGGATNVLIALSPNNTPFNLILTGVNTLTGQFIAAGNATITVGGAGTDVATTNVYTRYGGTIVVDDTTTPLNNRFGNGAGNLQTVGGGAFTILGNATSTVSETFKSFTPAAGADEFTVNATLNGSPVNLTLTATGGGLTHVAGESAVFNSTNIISGSGSAGTSSASFNVGAAAAAGSFLGAGTAGATANQAILPYALVNNNGTISLATSTIIGANGFLRNLSAGETTTGFANSFNYGNGTPVISGTWLTASPTINTTNTSGLYVGEAVSSSTGAGLPAGAYITAINPGVSVTINANTTAAQASAAGLTFTSAGTNLNLTAASLGPVSTLTQTINSLTLSTGGSLTLGNSNTVVTVGNSALGGAVLSLDPAATIAGGQISGGGSELIFHTPSNLTVSSNIIGAGQLTKGEAGSLTLTGTSFGTGQVNLAGGTLNLNAGNNTLQFPVVVDLGQGTTLSLNGNAQLLTAIQSDNTTGINNMGVTAGASSITGSGTLTLKQDNNAHIYAGIISGTQSLVFSGQNTLTLSQAQTYTGPTLINTAGGSLILQNSGALYGSGTTGSSSLTINRSGLTLDNTGTVDSSSRLPAGLAISLGGGTISYLGRTQFSSAETLGAVTATEGANTLSVTQQTTGLSSATLTLTSLTRTPGSTINFANTNGTLGTIGSNPQIMITGTSATTASGATSLLGGGYTVNGSDWAAYNSTYGVGALGATGFAGYSPLLLNNAASTDNVSMTTGTGVNIMGTAQNGLSQTINSLRTTSASVSNVAIGFGTSGASTSTNTLTLASGGLLNNLLGTGILTIGSSTNNGVLTSGGSEFFLYTNNNTTNTAGTVINSAISGTGMALVKSGGSTGTTTLNGTNTYTGGTYVDQGTLTLGNGGNVTLGQSTLGSGGIFLNGGNLTQTAGSIIPAQAVTITGSSTLTTTSDLVTAATSVTTLGSNTITVPNGALGVNGIHIGDLVTGTGIPGSEFVTAVNPANNTVTITSGGGVQPGTVALTFRNLSNTISNLTFNNDGGSSPTLTNTGLLNLTSGSITASSNNVGGVTTAAVSTLTGGNVDLGNVASPTITVNPISFNGQNLAPLQPTLVINSALQNASNAVSVTGGGNLQLGGASIFTGGVTLAGNATPSLATNLTIGANSTNAASGQPLSGPLGTGTLSIGANSTLYSTGSFSVGNNVVVNGNFTFDAPSGSAASLTLGAASQTIALPAGVATTITVNAPNMTGVLNDTVTGAGSTIVKAGLGVLQLNSQVGGSSTFSGGVVLNSGTLLATGVGAASAALGTGPVIINGGVLQLHHSGQTNNGFVTFGNNVDINTSLANAYIDIANNGANTGNTIVMGNLDYGTVSGTNFTSTVAGNPAPGTILNITGANNYKLLFNGTTLTGATSSPTFNVGSGLFLILPGGFTVGANLPTNIGPGTLSYSGSNTGAVASSPITGTVAVSPATGGSSTPLGAGGITLNGGSTLQIAPVLGSLSTTGYTSGGATAKYYYSNVAGPLNAVNYGIAPNSILTGVGFNDASLRMSPFGVNNNGAATNTLISYQALLAVTTGGIYNFGAGTDDNIQVVVDGQTLQASNGAGQALNQLGLLSVNLSAGVHQIVVREANSGSGGGSYIYYSGPDTASNTLTGTPPVNNLQALPLSALSYATNYTAGNSYQNAAILNNALTVAAAGSATIDGLGTDFNYAIPSLTLGNGSTLVVANGTGTAFGSAGNGVFIVTGATTLGATATLNQTTGTLVLAGGVTDAGNGLTKTGQGNLILGGSAGTFTGPLNISGGFVQLQDGAGLTTGTTTIGVAATTPATLDLNGQVVTTTGPITLNGGAGPAARTSNTPAGLYNSSATMASLPLGTTLTLGAATSAVNASVGGFGDISILGTISGISANQLDKVGPDTLILSNTNNFVGALNIKLGTVMITGANGVSSDVTNGVIETSGATLDLNGQTVAVAKALTLAGTGMTGVGAPNQLGGLVNSSAATAAYSGPVTLAGATSIGGPSLVSGVNGNITLSGALTGAQALTKVGANSLFLNNASDSITSLTVSDGSVTINGAGKLAVTANTTLSGGASLTVDNTTSAVSGRLFTGTAAGFVFSGNFTLIGNSSTAVTESITSAGNNLNLGGAGAGGVVVTLNSAGTGGVTLSTASTSTAIFNRAANAGTAVLRGDNLGTLAAGTANAANILGSTTSLGLGTTGNQGVGQVGVWNAPNALVYPWAVADTSAAGNGTGFAGYNGYTSATAIAGTAGNVQGNVFGVSPISINSNNAFTTAPVLTAIPSANLATSTTITVPNTTTGLAVGDLVTGGTIPANAVITSITPGSGSTPTTFTISAATTGTSNSQIVVYGNPTTLATGTGASGQTTVTVGSTANLYAGEVVSGTGITSGTTIASITSGTQFVLSANVATTLTGSNNLTFGLAGYANISSTAATNAFGNANAAQLINSLTLNNASSVSTITGGLQLDSGGVLALQSATINSGNSYSYLSGSTLNREMVFHTVGGATTLTVNAPIFVNAGGLTKADAGTLVLGTSELYTGDTVVNGGILKLSGGNNTLFKVFTTAPTPGNAASAVSGLNLSVDFGGTVDLAGNNQAVANLRSGSGTQLLGGSVINSGSAATFVTALNGNQTWAGNISNGQTIGAITGNSIGLTGSASGGTLNVVRDGNNTLTVNSPNTFGGTFTATGGATTLTDLGTFQNASAINVTRAALIWNDQGTQAVSNRLSSTAPITLSGGGLQFLTRAGAGSTPVDAISLGTLNLGVGASDVNISSVGQGGVGSVTFGGMGTRAAGATLNFGNATTHAGSNPNYYVTGLTNTNGIVGGWATVSSLTSSSGATNFAFATYDPVVGIRSAQYLPQTTYGAGVNTLVNSTGLTFTIPGNVSVATTTTVNSLTLYNSNLSYTNAFDTLVVQSGGILSSGASGPNLGTLATPGIVQSGAGNDLYIHNGTGTFNINAKIIDNGSSNNLVIDSMSAAAAGVVLQNANTFGGTTFISDTAVTLNSFLGAAIPHDLVLSGGNSGAADSIVDSSSAVRFGQSNQLNPTANVTMNGATRIDLGSAANVPGLAAPNTQTINNLTIKNDGGTNTVDGPTVFTGAGALTISGTLTSTNNTETFTIPTINGFLNLTTGNIVVDANQYVPNQVGLAINANITAPSITKTGLGFLGIGGQSQNLVGTTFNLNNGGLAFSPSTGVSNSLLGSAVVMAANTTIDSRALSGVLGSIASSSSSAVIMNGVQGTAGTLTTGLDNTSTTYAGSFSSPYPTGQLNVTKIGAGAWELTGAAAPSVSGTFTVSGGTVKLDPAGALNFQTYTANTGGTLLLDNTATATNNRLGGAFYTTSGTLAPTVRTLNLQGGNLTINGNSGTVIAEALGTVNLTGGGVITLNAAGTAGLDATLQALGGQTTQTSLFIQGDGLGTTSAANIATLKFATAGAIGTTPGLTFPTAGGAGANGTFIKTIRPDVLVSSSASGSNPSFLTIDSANGLVRPLNATTELQAVNATSGTTLPLGYTLNASFANGATTVTVGSTSGLFVGEVVTGTGIAATDTIASILSPTQFTLTTAATAASSGLYTTALAATTQNVKTGGTTPLFTNTTVDSVTLNSGGGFSSGIIPGNLYGSNGNLLTLSNTSTGILNTAGNNTVTATIANGSITADVHVLAGSTLNLNGPFTGTGGFTKAEGGTLVLGQQFLDNSSNETIAVNGGAMQLNSGAANTLGIYLNTGNAPVGVALAVNAGTLDLNGQSQLVGALTSQNPLPFGGGSGSLTTGTVTSGSTSVTVGSSAGLTVGSPVSGPGIAAGTVVSAISGNNITLSSAAAATGSVNLQQENIVITNTSATPTTFFTNAANTVFSGAITGNLSLDKSGNTTLTLTTPQTYAGATNIRGGNITLRDSATLASAAINANFAELIIDNTGLSTNDARISSTAALNLNGGALRVNQTSAQSTETFGTLNLNGGSNVFVANQYSNNANSSTGTFTISNLVANNNSTFLYSTQGTGLFSAAQNHLYLANLNGTPFSASSLVNGIIGAQFLTSGVGTNGFNWATYSNLGGVTNPNTNIGGTTTPAYGALNGGATVNANINASAISTAGQTLNTLRIGDPAAATTLGMNGSLDQLVLASGGLLFSNNNNQAAAIQGGSLTAGVLNTPSTLYLQVGTQNTLTINTPIVNNGATLSATTGQWSGGSGALSLVRSTGNLTVTLNPIQVEAVATPATATSTLTVPNTTGLSVGMAVTGTNITAGTTITAISGTANGTITLSTPTTAGTAGTNQTTFAPVQSTATGSTTLGSNTVTVPAANLPAGFVPAVGMTIGSSVNIPGGATITGVTLGTTDTFTLSTTATATSSTAALVFNALSNAYTGSTTINASVDQAAGGTTNLSGQPGSIVIPGNLTINGGATVTMNTNQGQIASTSAITINGGGILNLVGTNRFSQTLTFNNSGSNNVTPTVAVGALMDLSSTTAINANNDNNAFIPTISGTTLNLSSATGTTINTTGQSPNDLIISAAITTNAIGTTTTTGQTITKTGAGSLILPNANAAVLAWALNGGTIEVGADTSLGAAGSTLSVSGNVGLVQSANASRIMSLPITFTGASNLTLGQQYSNANNITLAGAINLNGQAATFTVATPGMTAPVITGQITGTTTGFTKAGAGPLTLTPASADTFTGPVLVNGGLLTLGNSFALPAALKPDLTVAAGAELDIKTQGTTVNSLSGGGILTNSSSSATLTIGGGATPVDTNFSGALTAATQGNLIVIKTGAANQTLSGQSFYTGATSVNQGTLTLKNGSNSATTATLNNTAITIGTTGTLAVSAAGAAAGTNNTVSIGDPLGGGASLTLSTAAGSSATLDLRDTTVNTFLINQAAASTALTIGGGTASQTPATLGFDIGATGTADTITSLGKVSVGTGTGGSIVLNALGSNVQAGSYTLITGATGSNLGTANLSLASTTFIAGGHAYTASLGSSTATQEILTLTPVTALGNEYWGSGIGTSLGTLAWNGFTAGKTNWSTAQGSFTEAGVIPASGTNVNFSVSGVSNLATSLGENFTINSLNVLGTNTAATSVSGNILTIQATNANGNTAGSGINMAANAGALTVNSAVVLGNSQTWLNNSSNTLSVAGSSITGAGLNLTVDGTGNTTISAPLQTGAGTLTKNGSGTLLLSNNTNSYSGGTTLNSGVTQITNSQSLGASTGAATINAATLEVTSNVSTTRNFTLGDAASTIKVDPGLQYITSATSVFSGGGNLNKTGDGTLIMNGTSSNYTGSTVVSAGTLLVGGNVPSGASGVLGNTASAITLGDTNTGPNSSPSLLTNGAFSVDRPINVANQPTTGTYTIGGRTNSASSFTGAITIAQNLSVAQAAGGSALTLSGGIASNAPSGTQTVNFMGAGPINVTTNPITDGAGAGKIGVSVTNSTTTTFAASNNSYTGPTSVALGSTLNISGSITGATAISLTGGTLLLSNTTASAVAGQDVTVTSGGAGSILRIDSSVSGVRETFGNLTLNANSTIDFGGAAGDTLVFNNFTLAAGQTLNIYNWNPGLNGANYQAGATDPNTDSSQDRLLFSGTIDPSLDFTAIRFYSDGGSTLVSGTNSAQIVFGGTPTQEIVPVPEPSSTALLGAAGLFGLIGFRERNRRRQQRATANV